MGRLYTVQFEKISVSALQDLFEIKGAVGKTLKVKRLILSDVDVSPLPAAQMLPIRARFLPATVTSGSGGSTPTPQKTDQGDAAASFTAGANNTTKATTNGTAVTFLEDGFHIYNGYDKPISGPAVVDPSTSIVLELITAPSGPITLSGTIEVEETG